MTEPLLYVTNTIIAKPNCIDKVRAALMTIVAPSRLESGCIRFDLVQCIEDPQQFVCIQVWQNLAAHRAHLASKHVMQGIDRVPELLASEFTVRRYHAVE